MTLCISTLVTLELRAQALDCTRTLWHSHVTITGGNYSFSTCNMHALVRCFRGRVDVAPAQSLHSIPIRPRARAPGPRARGDLGSMPVPPASGSMSVLIHWKRGSDKPAITVQIVKYLHAGALGSPVTGRDSGWHGGIVPSPTSRPALTQAVALTGSRDADPPDSDPTTRRRTSER